MACPPRSGGRAALAARSTKRGARVSLQPGIAGPLASRTARPRNTLNAPRLQPWTVTMSKKILFVDDDADFLESSQLMLMDCGYNVLTATDGHNAVEMHREEVPDITFLDIKMPGIDGYEAFERIRKEDSDARVVFTSSYALEGERYKSAQSQGLCALLNKPLLLKDLESAIAKHAR